jgi:hypothetical protein
MITTLLALQISTTIFALAAATLWFISASIKTPTTFEITGADLGGLVRAESPELTELGNAMKRQSRWSALAAKCAGVSAIAQAATILLQILN